MYISIGFFAHSLRTTSTDLFEGPQYRTHGFFVSWDFLSALFRSANAKAKCAPVTLFPVPIVMFNTKTFSEKYDIILHNA